MNFSQEQILDKCMHQIAHQGWQDFTIANIQDIDLKTAYTLFSDKYNLIDMLRKNTDQAVNKKIQTQEFLEAAFLDQVFEVFFIRFEYLTSYKPALYSMMLHTKIDVRLLKLSLTSLRKAADHILSCVAQSSLPRSQKNLFCLVYISLFRYWLYDTSVGYEKTQAYADELLRWWSKPKSINSILYSLKNVFHV